jgi:competence transcription factor ComK
MITNQQNCIFVQIHFSNDYKQQQNVRKTYSFSNIKTLLDMLGMQDFALNISKFSLGYMSPKTLKNLGLNVKLVTRKAELLNCLIY